MTVGDEAQARWERVRGEEDSNRRTQCRHLVQGKDSRTLQHTLVK